jgi:hypothetical protein
MTFRSGERVAEEINTRQTNNCHRAAAHAAEHGAQQPRERHPDGESTLTRY